jgi:type IV pilus assembly protein PilO
MQTQIKCGKACAGGRADQKQSIANNLAQFRHEKEILERRLAQALTELPNEANIDDLIRSLSEIGTKSGLIINSIDPQGEQKQSFYASIPIVMSVTGNYHEIGVFLDSLSKLARIVNVTNKMGARPPPKLVVSATCGDTFRFLPERPAAEAREMSRALHRRLRAFRSGCGALRLRRGGPPAAAAAPSR